LEKADTKQISSPLSRKAQAPRIPHYLLSSPPSLAQSSTSSTDSSSSSSSFSQSQFSPLGNRLLFPSLQHQMLVTPSISTTTTLLNGMTSTKPTINLVSSKEHKEDELNLFSSSTSITNSPSSPIDSPTAVFHTPAPVATSMTTTNSQPIFPIDFGSNIRRASLTGKAHPMNTCQSGNISSCNLFTDLKRDDEEEHAYLEGLEKNQDYSEMDQASLLKALAIERRLRSKMQSQIEEKDAVIMHIVNHSEELILVEIQKRLEMADRSFEQERPSRSIYPCLIC